MSSPSHAGWNRTLRVQGSGFRIQGSGFRVQGAGFRVKGVGFDLEGDVLGGVKDASNTLTAPAIEYLKRRFRFPGEYAYTHLIVTF